MEVAAIDECDLNGCSPQSACRVQAAESAADDYDVMDSFTNRRCGGHRYKQAATPPGSSFRILRVSGGIVAHAP